MTRAPWSTPTPPDYLDAHYALHPDGSRVQRLEDITRARAAATPDLPAVITAHARTSFRDLDTEASRVAQALLRDGVVEGDRVCYIGENASSFLAVIFGASKMGAIPTALNYRLAVPEMEYILGDSEPVVIVLGAGEERLLDAAAGIGSVRRVVTLAVDAAPGAEGGADRRAHGDNTIGLRTVNWVSWLKGVPDADPGHRRDPDDTALMFYTSGTTGHPKGIELTGANIGHALAAMHYLLELDTECIALAPVPFFHVTGFGLALVSIVNGAALLLLNPTSPSDLIRILLDHGVTHAVAVPTVIQFLLAQPEVRTSDWSALRYLVYGSSPIPEPVLRDATAVLGCRFLQSYGLTESTGGVTMLSPQDHRPTPETAYRLRSAGRPMANVPIRVVDPVTLEDVPVGERGEVLIGGDHVMRRYWRNPEATARAVTDGWLRTGDGGSMDADGYLFLHDRLKDMIVSGGENVFPAEVESVLTGHPGVAHAAVIGIPSVQWGESPFAVVVRVPGSTLGEVELIDWVRGRIAHYKCPVGVAFVEALPLNASGKLLKTQLREQYAAGQ